VLCTRGAAPKPGDLLTPVVLQTVASAVHLSAPLIRSCFICMNPRNALFNDTLAILSAQTMLIFFAFRPIDLTFRVAEAGQGRAESTSLEGFSLCLRWLTFVKKL